MGALSSLICDFQTVLHKKNIYKDLTFLGQTFQALDKFLGHDESHSMEQAAVSLWESALL